MTASQKENPSPKQSDPYANDPSADSAPKPKRLQILPKEVSPGSTQRSYTADSQSSSNTIPGIGYGQSSSGSPVQELAGFQPAPKKPLQAAPAAQQAVNNSKPTTQKNVPPVASLVLKIRILLRSLYLLALPVALGIFIFSTHPFRHELVSKVFSLAELNSSQRFNIELASRSLNGYVLKPGEQFSFNHAVGPRSDGRGYRPAASYLGPSSPATVGGGICLLSSALYQAALCAGLKIDERQSHIRTITSVEPGLDATVWYGRADLKISNNMKIPMQIKTLCKNNNLYVSLFCEEGKSFQTANLITFVASRNQNELMVETFRELDGKLTFVSKDHYQINR